MQLKAQVGGVRADAHLKSIATTGDAIVLRAMCEQEGSAQPALRLLCAVRMMQLLPGPASDAALFMALPADSATAVAQYYDLTRTDDAARDPCAVAFWRALPLAADAASRGSVAEMRRFLMLATVLPDGDWLVQHDTEATRVASMSGPLVVEALEGMDPAARRAACSMSTGALRSACCAAGEQDRCGEPAPGDEEEAP